MNRSLMRPTPTLFALSMILPVILAAGCNPYREGGAEASYDTTTYVSTSQLPKTVIVRDTRDGSEIWSYEVPVGRKLVVEFLPDRNENLPARPDMMRWGEMDPDDQYGSLKNEMPVPKSRILKLVLRDPGESAPGVKSKAPRASSADDR